MKVDRYLLPYIKVNSKYIKDLNVRLEILKVLQKNLVKTLEYDGISNYFLNRNMIVQEIRARISKWDCIKLKSPAHQRKPL
jgi:hypothetical protein